MPKANRRNEQSGLELVRRRSIPDISQRRLERFYRLSQAIEELLEIYTSFRDDLVQLVIAGARVEHGPLKIRRRGKELQVRKQG